MKRFTGYSYSDWTDSTKVIGADGSMEYKENRICLVELGATVVATSVAVETPTAGTFISLQARICNWGDTNAKFKRETV